VSKRCYIEKGGGKRNGGGECETGRFRDEKHRKKQKRGNAERKKKGLKNAGKKNGKVQKNHVKNLRKGGKSKSEEAKNRITMHREERKLALRKNNTQKSFGGRRNEPKK